MSTVPNPGISEVRVIVRYDPDQEAECVIAYSHRDYATTVTFGPSRPRESDRSEAMLIHVLRILVAPTDEL